MVEKDLNLAHSEGVNIYSRRDRDGEFKFLARDHIPTRSRFRSRYLFEIFTT